MAGMRYREIRPSPRLQPVVESFWTLDCDEAGAGPVQRIVPDGHSELILNVGESFEQFHEGGWQRQPRYFFAGQIQGPLLLRPNGRARILGVRFTPYGSAALLKMPMDELAGRITPVDDFAPALARALHGALESAKPVAAVERVLSANGAADPAIAAAVQRITASCGVVRLARLADELNLSSRQFERRFNAAVGLSPKTFCSLKRFTQVFRALGADGGRWVDTAVACGYYDQAHLIRDFKRFTGETPAALLAPEADLARHFLSRFGMSHSSNTAARGA